MTVPGEPAPMPPVVTIPVYHPPTVFQSELATKHTSCGMIFTGLMLILGSIGSIGMSGYIISKIGTPEIVIASLFSGSFFFIMGALAIYGGSSVWKRKGTIIICTIIGIIGIVAALVAVGFALKSLSEENDYRQSCILCHGNLIKNGLLGGDLSNPLGKVSSAVNIIKDEYSGSCDFMCSAWPYVILGIFAIFEGVFGLILSCTACCNSCSCCCCYKSPPSNVATVQSSFPNFPAVSNVVFSHTAPGDYAYSRLEG